MAITAQELIDAAYAKSIKNQPQYVANNTTELIGQVNRVLAKYFAGGARVNPYYFGEVEGVAFVGVGWARPADAEAVVRIEDDVGTEVVVVPLDDRAAEGGKPSVYRFGATYRPAGLTNDPTGPLTFYFSGLPEVVVLLADTIDARWPEQFNELLILDIAVYLAVKDGQEKDVANLLPQLQEWQMLYTNFLMHETTNERRRWGFKQSYNIDELYPIPSTLTGG